MAIDHHVGAGSAINHSPTHPLPIQTPLNPPTSHLPSPPPPPARPARRCGLQLFLCAVEPGQLSVNNGNAFTLAGCTLGSQRARTSSNSFSSTGPRASRSASTPFAPTTRASGAALAAAAPSRSERTAAGRGEEGGRAGRAAGPAEGRAAAGPARGVAANSDMACRHGSHRWMGWPVASGAIADLVCSSHAAPAFGPGAAPRRPPAQ